MLKSDVLFSELPFVVSCIWYL